MKKTLLIVIVLSLLTAAGVVLAQRGQRPPHQPPPEAFEACADLDEGDACTVETPQGELQGTCGYIPDFEELLCMPNRHREGPPPPPPQAFEACANLDEGDACTVETPRGRLQGTCGRLPDIEGLLCMPDHHPDGPPPPPRD